MTDRPSRPPRELPSKADPEIGAYQEALVATLRQRDPARLRDFARTWGERLNNRGLQQLAKAPTPFVERRLWQMVQDRPDLVDLHAEANAWLAAHPT